MDRREKIDCRANGEVIFRATRPLSLKSPNISLLGAVQSLTGAILQFQLKSVLTRIKPPKLLSACPELYFLGENLSLCFLAIRRTVILGIRKLCDFQSPNRNMVCVMQSNLRKYA